MAFQTNLKSGGVKIGKNNFQKVQEFNRAFDMVSLEPKVYTVGTIDELGRPQFDEFMNIRPELFSGDMQIIKLRLDLIKEEISELNDAIKNNDFIETRDALADILYVVYGMADVLGINIDVIFRKNISLEVNKNTLSPEIMMVMLNKLYLYCNNDCNNGIPIGLTNFDWIRYVLENIPGEGDVNKIDMLTNINTIYGELEEFCLVFKSSTENENNINTTAFLKIAGYIYELLRDVYKYSYICKINSNEDFTIVHNSNMSKLCDNEDDAKATVLDYEDKFRNGTSPYDSPYYYYLPNLEKWIIKNKSTGKALKNIKYIKVDFTKV